MDCNEIDARLRDLERTADLLRRQIIDEEAILELSKQFDQPTRKQKAVKLKTYSGETITVEPTEFIKHANDIAIRTGSDEIRQMVREGFGIDTGKPPLRPDGRRGRYINYAKLDPSEANVAGVLEAFGLRRAETPKGQKLKEAFTQQVAVQEIAAMARESGGNPAEIFAWMGKNTKGLDKLPTVMVSVARAKLEAAETFVSLIDDAADELQSVGQVSAQTMIELGNAGKFTSAFEALDAAMATKVGQALRARRGDFADAIKEAFEGVDEGLKEGRLVNLQEALNFEGAPRGSLLAQVLDAVERGDPQSLRRIATAKRIVPDSNLKRGDFATSMQLLNKVRKDNLFTSLATWMVRNPASTLVSFAYGLEDLVEGGLRAGVMDGLDAGGYAGRAMISGFQSGFTNALDSLRFGKQTYAVKNAAEVSLQTGAALKQEVMDGMNWAWNGVINSKGFNYVDWWNLINYSTRYVVGEGLDKVFPGQSVSYFASFRLMQGYDEFLRKGAFDWKVNHEGYIRAAQEAKERTDYDGMTRSAWITQRAEQLTETAVFDGVMNDDDLAKLRQREIGSGMGDDNIDNDTLRLKVFNELHGVPNIADELGAMGVRRGDDVTFTGDWSNNVERGLAMIRTNPLASYVVPVLKSPIKGMAWLFNRDLASRVVNQAAKEIGYAKGAEGLTPEVMATARARTIVSTGITATAWALWEAEILGDRGAGRDDPNQAERENRNQMPYSVAYGPDGMQGKVESIDLADLMLLQADIWSAWRRGSLTDNAMQWAIEQTMKAYTLALGRKQSLSGLIDIFGAFTGEEKGGLSQVLSSLHSGLIPASGLIGNMVRAGRDPNLKRAKRRWLSPEEMKALGQNDGVVWGIYKGTMEFLDRATWNTPFPTAHMERDWLGLNIERPMGIPVDATIPFMPVKRPNDGTFRWLEKHGFSQKPRSTGSASSFVSKLGIEANIQMTNEEEGVYREQMRTLRGQADVSAFLGRSATETTIINRIGGIDQFVDGKTLHEALTALRLNEKYAVILTSPTNNPSRMEGGKYDKPLDTRKNSENDPYGVYDPIDVIIRYYDTKAMVAMANDPEVGEPFVDRVKKTAQYYNQELIKGIQVSPMGLGRQ